MVKPKLLITGASGYIGSALLKSVSKDEFTAIAISQKLLPDSTTQIKHIQINDEYWKYDWTDAVRGVDIVIHLAARAHIVHETSDYPEEEFFKANTLTTVRLAKKASEAGVKRFIYMSTIGVNGSFTPQYSKFTELDPPRPTTHYARSKWEAEKSILKIGSYSGMEIVVLRPPLVYGKCAKGNFENLLKKLAARVPIPLSSSPNRRSFISLDNLIDLIIECIKNPAAANQTFLVSDGIDFSTSKFINILSVGLKIKPRIIILPPFILKFVTFLMGRRYLYNQLYCSLQVDSSKIRKILNWTPKKTIRRSIVNTARTFLEKKNRPKIKFL